MTCPAKQEHKIVKVVLPYAEAIQKAAKMNFLRDVRIHKKFKEDMWESIKGLYIEEASYLFSTSGKNYEPEYPDTEHIFVEENPEWLTMKTGYKCDEFYKKLATMMIKRLSTQIQQTA